MKTLKEATVQELENEIKRKKREAARKKGSGERIFIDIGSPNGAWLVTTQGDVEGRTTSFLGVFRGHIADIAFKLSRHSNWTLRFEKFDPKSRYDEPRDSVDINLDYKKYSIEDVEAWITSRRSMLKYDVKESNLNSAFKLNLDKSEQE